MEPNGVDLSVANAVYLYNIENGMPLVEKNCDERIQPVSTAKIMSGLVACEALDGRLDEIITVTSSMIEGVIGNRYNLAAGHTLSVRDLLYLAFCGGCHNSINVLAYVIADNVPNFITMMNAKASELGMNDTFYTNPFGLHSETMYTTVNDIAKLCLAASKNDLLMQITSTDSFTTENNGTKNFLVENRNDLVSTGVHKQYYNSLCRGLAAGSTLESGYCAATIADNGELSYLCIVMGAGTDASGTILSYDLVNKLISWVYKSWGYVEVITEGTTICEMPVTMSMDIDSVLVVPSRSVSVYLPLSTELGTDVTYTYSLNSEKLQAPVAEGAQVGFITAKKDGKEIATVELVTKNSVAQSEILYVLARIKEISQSRVFLASVIFAVCFTALYIIIKSIIRGTASNKRYKRR
ncbi:MAG: D-alanyl-D-alanine carboxypeptidase family protein [Eubacteriales bacterium]